MIRGVVRASGRGAGRGVVSGAGAAVRCLLALGVVVACAPGAVQTPSDAASKRDEAAEAASTAGVKCTLAECWAGQAAEAERLGAIDVAASRLGQAFLAEPTSARLGVWIDLLLASGAVKRAREGLIAARTSAEARGDRGLVAEVERRLAALPTSEVGKSPSSAPPSAAVAAGYAALAAGQLDAAAAGFAGVTDPYHLAYAGEVQARRGDMVAARRSWAAARTGLYERGVEVQIHPVEPSFVRTTAWHGAELGLMAQISPLHSPHEAAGELQLRAPVAGASARRLYFPRPSATVAFTRDGLGFLREEDGKIVWQDLLSGSVTRTVATPGERVSALLTEGTGDDARVLVAAGRDTTLWDAQGRELATYRLAGTTPTILRVYGNGEGTRHDNILRDSPTWPVALAMTAKAGLVAIAGSDAIVRVYASGREKPLELAFQWTYTERRHRGGNPDLNLPLALRFDAQERLIAVHEHGDILVWDPRSGAALQHHTGRCTLEEAMTYVNRYTGAGAPQQKPDEAAMDECGRASVGDISSDGSLVITGGRGALRTRTPDGKSVQYVAARGLPDQYLRLADDGTLGLVNQYGEIAVWRGGVAEPERVVTTASTSPLVPVMSADGSTLHFDLRTELVFWDLAAGRRTAVDIRSGGRLLALDAELSRMAVQTADAVEVREVAGGRVLSRHAASASTAVSAVAGGRTFAILLTTDDGKSWSLVISAADGTSTTQVAPDGAPLAVSADGRWLAMTGPKLPLTVRGLRMAGRLMHTLDVGVRHFAFSGDGVNMAWMAQPDASVPEVKVRVQAVEGAARAAEMTLQGWPQALAFTPDGAEVLVLLQSGKLTRWRWASDERVTLAQLSLVPAQSVMAPRGGEVVLLPGFDHVQVRSNDREMRRLGTLYPLARGGWLAVSSAGALAGSDDAVESTISRAIGGDTRLVFSGRVAWDGAHVPGTWARVLAGEDVAPPVLVRPPVVETPL